jgi:hypothetical protein
VIKKKKSNGKKDKYDMIIKLMSIKTIKLNNKIKNLTIMNIAVLIKKLSIYKISSFVKFTIDFLSSIKKI